MGKDSVGAALRFLDAVDATFQKICEQPLAYQRFDLGLPGFETLRKCSVKGFRGFLVFYRVDAEMVEIIRVLHGARDILRLFEESGE
jgi:toxin ParE1/3/4